MTLLYYVCASLVLSYLQCSYSLKIVSANTADQSPPTGDIFVHDPSSSAYDVASDRWYSFSTAYVRGQFLATHVSTDGYAWQPSAPIFSSSPSWIHSKVPANGGNQWAPDILQLNGIWHLFYATSSFGSQTSCIGLATSPVLDPKDPKHLWSDQGPVICSNHSSLYNTIDPHVFVEPRTNQTWMNFGSFWNGIFVVRLDGFPIVSRPVGAPVSLARATLTGENPIEASWVQPDPFGAGFWLFVNWGYCCRGVNSTYSIKVGHSTRPDGPYIDQNGVDLIKSGGTLLIGTADRQIGPGHIGFPTAGPSGSPGGNTSAPKLLTYHYYDRNGSPPGQHTLGQAIFQWNGPGGWPVAIMRE